MQVTACVPENRQFPVSLKTLKSIHCHPPSVKRSASRTEETEEASCPLTSSYSLNFPCILHFFIVCKTHIVFCAFAIVIFLLKCFEGSSADSFFAIIKTEVMWREIHIMIMACLWLNAQSIASACSKVHNKKQAILSCKWCFRIQFPLSKIAWHCFVSFSLAFIPFPCDYICICLWQKTRSR